MRPGGIVMLDEHLEHVLEVSLAPDE